MLLIKAFIYRIFRMIIVFISGYLVLGDPSIAISIMSIDVIAATIFYYYFDKYWKTLENLIQGVYLKWKYRKMK